jgi:uncharacterized protein (DUF2237 family)
VTLRYKGALRHEADVGNRTRDLILTMDALYQLSYVGNDACIVPPQRRRRPSSWCVCARRSPGALSADALEQVCQLGQLKSTGEDHQGLQAW